LECNNYSEKISNMDQTGSRYTVLLGKLRKKGYRITPQRAAILKAFTESRDHPSVEQVYDQIKPAFPMTSLATVYKAVSMLKDENEILDLGFAGGSSRYDGNNPSPHTHLICIRCQKIIDADLGLFNDLSRQLADQYGYQIINQLVDFFGVCPQCQQQKVVGLQVK
jgi:Fur family transcriptional regulator, peroxide stress response regulator